MNNILSFDSNKLISGKEIKEWLIYNTTHETSHTKDAVRLKKFMNVKDDTNYKVVFTYIRTRDCKMYPTFVRVK